MPAATPRATALRWCRHRIARHLNAAARPRGHPAAAFCHPLAILLLSARLGAMRESSPTILRHLTRVTTSGRYVPEIDGIRFVAIAWVVLVHIHDYFTWRLGFAL